MIYSDMMILLLQSEGELQDPPSPLVVPWNAELVNPASIDLRLSGEFINMNPHALRYWKDGEAFMAPSGGTFEADSLTLYHGDAILAATYEYVRIPNFVAAQLLLKSSAARKGLDHALAGWIDPGFEGQLTLELHAHRVIELEKSKAYFQMVLMQMAEAPQKPYSVTGRYQGQLGPTLAKG